MMERLISDNTSNLPGMNVFFLGWLTRDASKKRHSTVVIEFIEATKGNEAISRNLI